MANPAKRLGRGLSSIISVGQDISGVSAQAVGPAVGGRSPHPFAVGVGQLRPNPFQPRQEVRPEDLQSLAASIRVAGVVQPIIVRQAAPGLYEIIAGERRWRAAQLAGLAEIPAIVRSATDEQVLEIALIENVCRTDLNPIERATAYRRYRDQFGLSAEEVAARLGEDRTTVTNYLRLLELPAEVKEWVAAGRLDMGHARCLLGLRSPGDQVRAAREAIDKDLSVRAVEKLVRERAALAAKPVGSAGAEGKRPQIRNLEQAFVQALGTKVEINESRRRGSGRIVIHYFSLDDFDRITQRLGVSSA